MFGQLNKQPFCQCLHEIESGLPRTTRCFMACQDQITILAQREKAITDTIKHLQGISNPEGRMSGFKDTDKSFSFIELIEEVKNQTEIGKEYVARWKDATYFLNNL